MRTTTSTDGTTLGYDVVGSGPALVLVPGVFDLRDVFGPLVAELAATHACCSYDRRARGDSGDTRPYAVEREVEDLAAVVEAVGGRASVFGCSSGAVLALRAAAAGVPVERLFLNEPPFRFDDEEPAPAADLPDRLQAMVDEGRGGDAVSAFQREAIGLPAEVVAGLREAPFFPALAALAQSVVHDAVLTATLAVPSPEMAAVRVPTVVLRGGRTWPRLATAAERLVALLPDARLQVLPEAADHGLEPLSTAAAVRDAR